MTSRCFRISTILLLLGAVLVRVISMPSIGFFCDVPSQIRAMESQSYVIQFPGYVPYHLLITSISWLTESVFSGLLLLKKTTYNDTLTLEVFSRDKDYLKLSLEKIRALWDKHPQKFH